MPTRDPVAAHRARAVGPWAVLFLVAAAMVFTAGLAFDRTWALVVGAIVAAVGAAFYGLTAGRGRRGDEPRV